MIPATRIPSSLQNNSGTMTWVGMVSGGLESSLFSVENLRCGIRVVDLVLESDSHLSEPGSNLPGMSKKEALPPIDEVNEKYLFIYGNELQAKGLESSTVVTKRYRIISLIRYTDYEDLLSITHEKLEEYIVHRRKTVSKVTVNGDILEIKLFYKRFAEDRVDDLFKNIKIKKIINSFPVDKLLRPEDIIVLAKAARNHRDRTIMMFLWDSGARISEITSLNIGHIQYDNYGAQMIVSGKTGKRYLRLTDSVPDLQKLISDHPLRGDPGAPLFVIHSPRKGKYNRLSNRGIAGMINRVAKNAGVDKKVNPHGFRHGRMTDFCREETPEMMLRTIAGWKKNSAMPEVYIQLAGTDIDKKVLAIAGLSHESAKPETTVHPKICPRCKKMCAFDEIRCTECGLVLDQPVAMSLDERKAMLGELVPVLMMDSSFTGIFSSLKSYA